MKITGLDLGLMNQEEQRKFLLDSEIPQWVLDRKITIDSKISIVNEIPITIPEINKRKEGNFVGFNTIKAPRKIKAAVRMIIFIIAILANIANVISLILNFCV